MSGEISSMLAAESAKLEGLLDSASPGMAIPGIVEIYYQVMNVSSMVAMLGEQDPGDDVKQKAESASAMISEKFNAKVHPMLSKHLADEVGRMKKELESGGDAESFEALKKTMSTREFVEQYEKGLH